LGTYTIAADGALNINPSGSFSTITGSLSADGNRLVASQVTTEFFEPEILIGIKQGQTNFSNTNLKGTYTTVRYDSGGAGAGAGSSDALWTVIFDGAGSFTGTYTLNSAGKVSSGAVSGTYTVAADGALNISPTGGFTIAGGLSADGSTVVLSQTAMGASPGIMVGIKQGQTNFSNANLKGTYTAVRYDQTSGGTPPGPPESVLLTLTFDGAGGVTGTSVDLSGKSVTVSGTYTVAADGTLTISAGVQLTGGLSADGSTLVATQTTSGNSPSILVGVLR
jgi:hypothetical protein